MSQPLAIVITLLAAYLFGSFPSAYIMGRLRKGIDIRTVGSHNMGAMNSVYNIGFIWGAIVLAFDLGKGLGAVAVAHWLGGKAGLNWLLYFEMLAGVISVLGHRFPLWLKFKGGKGGATVIGVILYFIPWGWPIGFGIFLVLLAITRVPTISYGLAMLSFPLISWLIYHNGRYVVFSALLMLIPFVGYIPRLVEMRQKGGSWKRVFSRKSVKDRL
jgi:acyl phosphate:glycerol-3-phosphate acyltransferase